MVAETGFTFYQMLPVNGPDTGSFPYLYAMIRLRSIWFGLIACLLLATTACLNTRPVEPPDSSGSDWVSPTDYNILLDNLKTAISQRNTQNYLRCFDPEGLAFFPVASLFNDNESIWLNWSLQDEQAWFDNMVANLASPSGNSLVLEEADLQDVSPDSLRYVGNYSLRINHSDSTLTTLYKGQLQMVIGVNSFNEWEIRKWEDFETHPDSSWSRLKLVFVQ
jgi:hypothetical protein